MAALSGVYMSCITKYATHLQRQLVIDRFPDETGFCGRAACLMFIERNCNDFYMMIPSSSANSAVD